jgi:hypothetical protein
MNYHFNRIFFSALFGFVSCLIIGFALYGQYIFRFIDARSMIISYGLLGSVYFGILRLYSTKSKLLVLMLLFLIYVLHANSISSVKLLVRDTVLLSSAFIALNIYYRLIFKNQKFVLFIRAIILSVLFAITYSIATLVLAYLFEPDFSDISIIAFTNIQYSSIIGMGLGLGFDLHEKVFVRSKWNNKYLNNTPKEFQ